MADRLDYVIAHRTEVVQSMERVDAPDTLAEEIALLTSRQ